MEDGLNKLMQSILCLHYGMIVFGSLHALDIPQIKALAMVESGNDSFAKGKNGERTEFQISKEAWDEIFYGQDIPFRPKYYHDEHCKKAFLMKWSQKYERLFNQNVGRTPNDLEFYAMYNMGFAGFRKYKFKIAKLPSHIRERCMRYYNLVMLYENNN
jgi:hypothetical protein